MIKVLFVCHGRTVESPINQGISGQNGAMLSLNSGLKQTGKTMPAKTIQMYWTRNDFAL